MSETSSTPRLTEYDIHDVLRNERRTQVIEHLKRDQETVTVRELSEQLAALETGETPPPRNIRESVYNALHQTHLPKLDELGIIEYERDRKLVTLADASRQVSLYMEVVPEDDVTWATYNWVLGVLALSVVALSSISAPVVSVLPAVAWASVFIVVLALSALYRVWKHEWISFGPD